MFALLLIIRGDPIGFHSSNVKAFVHRAYEKALISIYCSHVFALKRTVCGRWCDARFFLAVRFSAFVLCRPCHVGRKMAKQLKENVLLYACIIITFYSNGSDGGAR